MNWMFLILALIISLLLVADAKHAGSAYEAESANAETNKVPQRYVATKRSLPQTEAPAPTSP